MNTAQIQKKLNVGPPGQVKHWSQRALEPTPYLNCRFYSFLVVLWYAGMRWEGSRQTARAIAEQMRKTCGRPEIGPGGKLQGTSAADLDRAIAVMFPWIRVQHMRLSFDDIVKNVAGNYLVSTGFWLPLLPANLQKYSGAAAIGHQTTLVGGRVNTNEVKYLDPLGPWLAGNKPYEGVWVKTSAISMAMSKQSGLPPFCTIMERGDAMLTTIQPVKAYSPGTAKAKAPKGKIAVFRVKQGDFVKVNELTLGSAAVSEVTYEAKVVKQPARQPQGRFAQLTEAPFNGRFVRSADVTITVTPPTGNVDAAYKRGYNDGHREGVAEFTPIEDTVYERTS